VHGPANGALRLPWAYPAPLRSGFLCPPVKSSRVGVRGRAGPLLRLSIWLWLGGAEEPGSGRWTSQKPRRESSQRISRRGRANLCRMESDAGSDRRVHARAPIELKVEYKRLNTFFADYTKNISRGGTFIATERPLPIDTEFVFALGVPSLDEPLRLRGKVIWIVTTDEASKANPPGMGIEFQYSGDAERREKEAAVERLLTRELGEHLATKLLGRAPHS